MKSFWLLCSALTFLLAASGPLFAAVPNIQYGSFSDSTATFTGKESIYIPVSDTDAAPIKQVVELIRTAAREAGLIITDTPSVAQRMLTFEVRPFSKITHYDDVDSTRTREVTDTSYNSIQIYIYDIQRRVEGRIDPVWAGVMNAPDPLFNSYLDQLLVKLFALYGKSELKREVFQPLDRPTLPSEQLPDSAAGPRSLTPASDSSSNLRDSAALQPD